MISKYSFRDLYGKSKVKVLFPGEKKVETRCPIDGQNLYETIEDLSRCNGSTETVYCCPCCSTTYPSIDPKILARVKALRVQEVGASLEKLDIQKSHLEKILQLALSSS